MSLLLNARAAYKPPVTTSTPLPVHSYDPASMVNVDSAGTAIVKIVDFCGWTGTQKGDYNEKDD
jgi:hypothetical protein